MFEISVTREFEDWYQALDAESAEKIAAELNVLERLGPELDAERSSPLLLWFDGAHQGEAPSGWGRREAEWGLSHLLRRQHEALRCLETPNFLARFLQLDPRQARRGHELVERLRASVRAANLQLVLSRRQTQLALPQRSFVRAASLEPSPWAVSGQGVQDALLELLAFVGLRAGDVADRSSGLRELTVAELTPAQRLLYAIDAPRRRILAILGEALDRAYYGDSVRLAERRWRDYCRSLPVRAEAR